MTEITSTNYDYNAAMETIQAEITEWCEAQGVDPNDFLANLDGGFTASVFDNPTLEAYFQLAYMQLVELLYPEVINSLEAEIGEVTFETLYDSADEEFNNFIISLIEDDPEIMALYAMQAGGETEGDFVLALLAALNTETSADLSEYGEGFNTTDDLREYLDSVDLGADMENELLAWAEAEDVYTATEMAILDRLAEYDQAMNDLVAALESGDISETQFESEMQNITFGRETLMAMLQQVTDQKMQFFETISELYDQAFEMQNTIINNMRAY